jgi:hypothetical protein
MTSMTHPNRNVLRGALAAGVGLILTLVGGVSTAVGADDAVAGALETLESHGLLMTSDADSTAGEPSLLSTADGLTVRGDQGAVGLAPITDVQGVRANEADAILYPEGDHVYALTGGTVAADAGYVLINGQGAPTEFRFALTVDGSPATLELLDSRVVVRNAIGDQVNVIQAPWAKDASGNAIPTEYSLEGSTLVQRVEHAGADYPVVADPRLACDGLWCTLELTRHETGVMADNALNPGIICGLLGPGAGPCIVAVAAGWEMANLARNTGQCIGIRVWQKTMWTQLHLAYIPCYA